MSSSDPIQDASRSSVYGIYHRLEVRLLHVHNTQPGRAVGGQTSDRPRKPNMAEQFPSFGGLGGQTRRVVRALTHGDGDTNFVMLRLSLLLFF